VNTTAKVYVPTTGSTVLLSEEGIKGIETQNAPGLDYDYVEFDVGSGEHTFVSSYNP